MSPKEIEWLYLLDGFWVLFCCDCCFVGVLLFKSNELGKYLPIIVALSLEDFALKVLTMVNYSEPITGDILGP